MYVNSSILVISGIVFWFVEKWASPGIEQPFVILQVFEMFYYACLSHLAEECEYFKRQKTTHWNKWKKLFESEYEFA